MEIGVARLTVDDDPNGRSERVCWQIVNRRRHQNAAGQKDYHWSYLVLAVSTFRGIVMRSACLAILLASLTSSSTEPIATEQFGKLHALIKPGPNDEKWNEIPWLSDLWEARKKAAADGKPILLWEMDGNPLGCV
jgi:hypothetical protein